MINNVAWAAHSGLGNDYLKVGGIKIIYDGGVGLGTALLRKPYKNSIHGKKYKGLQRISKSKLESIIYYALEQDLRLAIHQSGGLATDNVFDIYESFGKTINLRSKRMVAVHCQFPTPRNIEQVKAMNIHVATQTLFMHTMGEQYINLLGIERARMANPLRDWLSHGVRVSLGSDAPVNTYNPFVGIWHAMTRQMNIGQILGDTQCISLEDAFRCYTINGAYSSFDENFKGSLDVGKVADIVVLSNNIFKYPVDNIKNTHAVMTIVNGDVVYESNQNLE